jgi:acetyl-CoA synthetase
MKHSAVAMAAVIGAPDPVRGSIIKAFIVTRAEIQPDEVLRLNLQDHVRRRLSGHQYPRALEFVDSLPLTATGKVRRRDLREMEEKKSGVKN